MRRSIMSKWIAVAAMAALLAVAPAAMAAEETADGLKATVQAIVDAAKAGKGEEVQKLTEALFLPDAGKFFTEVFGEELGKKLADEYARLPKPELAKLFEKVAKDGRTNVTAWKIAGADDENATGLQKEAIKAMKKPVALYSVRMAEPGKTSGMTLWSFVYVDGAFRIAGKMRAVK